MSNKNLARRTEITVKIMDVNVSADINKHLLSMIYTDNEEDKTDDIRLELDDREGIWLEWLGREPTNPRLGSQADSAPLTVPVSKGDFIIGDTVNFKGGNHYHTSMDTTSAGGIRTAGKARITNLAPNATHSVHLIGESGGSNVHGWVNSDLIENLAKKAEESESGNDNKSDIKGAKISAVIIQKKPISDGKDRLLDCGVFEIDAVDASGPGATVSIKATSLPYSSSVRKQKKTRGWENTKLSDIANVIAKKNRMKCMFISSFDPIYKRREQVNQSDIKFLEKLCKSAGISLKITAGQIVLFDAADFEKKAAVIKIERGKADVKTYRFGTSLNDTKYSKCRVSYTDPVTRQTIEYTYTPRDSDNEAPVLEINEKVSDRNEAKNLAMKRLRQKNKSEFSAEFTLIGDARLVAGITVNVSGWGFFDGKYIIETAVHRVTASGYTTEIKLRRVLEDY